MTATETDFEAKRNNYEFSNIGPVIINNIIEFFQNDLNTKVVEALIDPDIGGIHWDEKRIDLDQKTTLPLLGMVFVLTGSMENMTRSQAKAHLEALGGKVSNSVSKNTNYVIAASGAGSKLEKAKELKLNILNEQEFLKFLRNHED